MNTQTELHGKIQISYIPKNDGISIGSIEKIDKYSDIYESSEGRFKPKVEIVDTIEQAIDFVYNEKKYISKETATEIVNDFLNL